MPGLDPTTPGAQHPQLLPEVFVLQYPHLNTPKQAIPATTHLQAHTSLNLLFSLFQAEIDFLKISLPVKDVDRSYHHSLTFSSASCRISPPIPPNPSVLLVVGLLFCIIYATVFLETYAHRLCRKISASFFESREDERARYLYGKLSRQHRKQHS